MGDLALLGLVGLALIDSTSIGTLVLPLVMLLTPRVSVGRYLLFLATVAGFYAVVGIALVAGASWLTDVASSLADVVWLRWLELVIGVVLFAIGVLGDPRRFLPGRRDRARRRGQGPPARSTAWRARLVGADAAYGTVVTIGLAAALVEVASMLPFLAAIGIITASDLAAPVWIAVVVGYTLVMVLPALVLLVLRLALDRWVRGLLTRLSEWLDRNTAEAVYWVCAIVGIVLMADAGSVVL